MDNLMVICEGGVHTVEYLHRNGVFPKSLLIEPNKFQEISPYLTKDDDILLIIKGLTDFTMASIYGLLAKFDEFKDKYKRVTILTNIPLGSVHYDYYLYSGDLFYGDVKLIVNKKSFELDDNGNVVEKQKKSLFSKKKSTDETKKNPIMFQFKKYNDRKTQLMIYGKTNIGVEEREIPHLQEYEDKIQVVDLFKNKSEKIEETEKSDINLVKE